MTRLTIPEPDITLYEDGFDSLKAGEKLDVLDRKPTGDALSGLVDRIAEPMVIALDGGWGSGKSFFLKCWVGQHLKRDANTTQTVYFDAFANDFMDEPLVSLLACLLNRFEDKEVENNPNLAVAKPKLESLKAAATNLGPASLRIGTGVLAALVKNYVGDISDVLVDGVESEISSSAGDLWDVAQKQQNVMAEFGEALKKLTLGEDGEPRKLVIVVDELDRCRPDYALALLEIIKHFFAVDHVHFVLGVNLRELENSVKARYGGGINAGLYLQKFVTLTMGLPEHLNGGRGLSSVELYFEKVAAKLAIEKEAISLILRVAATLKEERETSLRGFQRLASLIVITPSIARNSYHWGYDDEPSPSLLAHFVILKAWFPKYYSKAISGSLTMADVQSVFEIPPFNEALSDQARYQIVDELEYHLAPDVYDARNPDVSRRSPRTRAQSMRRFQSHLTGTLEVFSLR